MILATESTVCLIQPMIIRKYKGNSSNFPHTPLTKMIETQSVAIKTDMLQAKI